MLTVDNHETPCVSNSVKEAQRAGDLWCSLLCVLLFQGDAAPGSRGAILDMKIDRKTEILRSAIELIADEGYGSLSMRALARASGMKLGALQYHFRTWDALLFALVAYIEAEIISAFDASKGLPKSPLSEI